MRARTLLSQDEYESLLDCIHRIHSFSDLPSLRLWLLETALPQLIPSDWLSYNEVNLLHPENTMSIVKPEFDPTMQQLFPRFQQVAHQHPLIVRQMHAVDFPVHKISDFLPQDAFHRLELYQDVYRHLGIEYQIAATLRLEPECIMAFALSRQRQDYTERDRAVLEMLRPHLVVAFNNLALAEEQQTRLDEVTLAMHALSSATIIATPEGRVLNHTGPGLQWIGATFPGVLPAAIADWLRQDSAGAAMSLKVAAGEVQIRTVPTSSRERVLLVLTLENLLGAPWPDARNLMLSKRQGEVAGWICQGKTNAEIAAILGISPRTVQKHLEHIFAKLGVESRLSLSLALTRNFHAPV